MEYFQKKLGNQLLITTISSDSEVIVLSGDYIIIWEKLEPKKASRSYLEQVLEDPELVFLKPFFEFLVNFGFGFVMSDLAKAYLIEEFSKGIDGSFNIIEQEISPIYAFSNGTDPYGWAEPCPANQPPDPFPEACE